MTAPDWPAIRAAQEAHRTLISRLEAGDELHQEAAREITRLRKELKEVIRDGERDARDAYSAGRLEEQIEAEERGRW